MTKPADSEQAIPSPEDRVRAIREREQKATKGPWTRSANSSSSVHVMARRGDIWGEDSEYVRLYKAPDNIEPLASLKGDCERRKANADFIAHARSDIPYLLSLVEELIPFCDSPCGHTSQYAYSEDGGKNIVCLICEREELKGQVAELEGSREHTWEWITRHYGKLQDWARTVLPEPWSTQFFNCIANGLYDPVKDVGKTYICNAGFEVTPGGYFKMPTAEYQILCDQMKRAETAEAEAALLTKRKDYHAEYVEAVEAKREFDWVLMENESPRETGWYWTFPRNDDDPLTGASLPYALRYYMANEHGNNFMNNKPMRGWCAKGPITHWLRLPIPPLAALTPEPATKAEVQK